LKIVKHVTIKKTKLANTDARQDNNIVVFEEKIQDIKNRAVGKRKIQEFGMSKVIRSFLKRHKPWLMTKKTMKPLRKTMTMKNARVRKYGKMN